MRPVTQTRVGRPYGNCWAACIASILEVPIEAVDWSADLTAEEIEGTDGQRADIYNRRRRERVASLGYSLLELNAESVHSQWDAMGMEGVHLIGYGPNSSGIGHACVYLDRACVWDPNPARLGLSEVLSYGFLVRR